MPAPKTIRPATLRLKIECPECEDEVEFVELLPGKREKGVCECPFCSTTLSVPGIMVQEPKPEA